jgi:hypothetical protein
MSNFPEIFSQEDWNQRSQALINSAIQYTDIADRRESILQRRERHIRLIGEHVRADFEQRTAGFINRLNLQLAGVGEEYLAHHKLLTEGTIIPFFFNVQDTVQASTGCMYIWLEEYKSQHTPEELAPIVAAFDTFYKLELELEQCVFPVSTHAAILPFEFLQYSLFKNWFDKLSFIYYELLDISDWVTGEIDSDEEHNPEQALQTLTNCSGLILELCQEYGPFKEEVTKWFSFSVDSPWSPNTRTLFLPIYSENESESESESE